jgi:protein-S-isoprenylcysteine O-methyltransferase Ste14
VLAVFGLVVGSTQHFRGWARIMSGKFKWGDQWYLNSWMLSGFAILIIVALVLLIWRWKQPSKTD